MSGGTGLLFFYGTLLDGYRPQPLVRAGLALDLVGAGTIRAGLFDLGAYPAAVPGVAGVVRGEVHRARDPAGTLAVLDAYEGFDESAPASSLFVRRLAAVWMDAGPTIEAWTYFYREIPDGAVRVSSGDYLAHLRGRS